MKLILNLFQTRNAISATRFEKNKLEVHIESNGELAIYNRNRSVYAHHVGITLEQAEILRDYLNRTLGEKS